MLEFQSQICESKCIKNILADINSGKVVHAYLFSCSDLLLSKNTILQFAKLLFCQNGGCNNCSDCKKIETNTMADMKIVDGTTDTIKVETINGIVEDTYIKPYEQDKKIYIILNAENMTEPAQNKLLKTLEEPPENVLFLLSCQNECSLLPTIRSRCKLMQVDNLKAEEISAGLVALGYTKKISDKASTECFANTLNAVELAKNQNFELPELALSMLVNMHGSKDILEYASKFSVTKKQLPKLLDFVIMYTRDAMIAKSKVNNLIVAQNHILEIDKLTFFSTDCLSKIIKKCIEAKQMLAMNVSDLAVCDNLLFYIAEVKSKCKK